MQIKTIKDFDFNNKAVLLRVDYNVPLKKEESGTVVVDDTRIRQSLDTINYILTQNPKRLVLMSHLGDPKTPNDPDFSLKPIAQHLEKLLNKKIELVVDYRKQEIKDYLLSLNNQEIILLENVRYYKEEELNSREFAADLAQLGDVFVNDAFGSCHRAHASVVGVAEFLPAIAGLLLEKEIIMLGKIMENPQSPFIAILGGAKATTKIPVIERLMTKADIVLLGGGVANTFLKAFGFEIGNSLYSPESLRICRTLIWRATRSNTKLFLPTDAVIGNLATGHNEGVVDIELVPKQFQILDIGPKTQIEFSQIIQKAKTLVWNGPVGANETPGFEKGTEAVYNAVVANRETISVVGGGDTLSSINGHDHLQNITHISTGGGAMLEFIEKGTLPGIEALQRK